VSSSGDALAVVTTEAVAVSRDAGATFVLTPFTGVRAACFGGADGKTLYVLSVAEGEVTLRALQGEAVEEVAVLHDRIDSMVQDVRLAWCEAREALIVVSSGGSLAIGPRHTH
jgi:hypothetical protein